MTDALDAAIARPDGPSLRLPLQDHSQISAARRTATAFATLLELSAGQVANAALLATEAATNVLKHAGEGELLLRALEGPSLELLAIDRGPGLDPMLALRDGYSTSGGLGGGLGAMRRLADDFQLYSSPGQGTIVRLAIGREAAARFERAGLTVPHPAEQVCGDAWKLTADGSTALAVLADGLGHGPEALIAAGRASALVSDPRQPPEQLLQAAHEALHGTRGAAVLCVQIDLQSRVLRHAGVGNVTGVLIDADGRSRQLLSHGGIVGHQRGRVQAFELEWKPASMLVLHSDGISTHWRPEAYPGLLARHPALLTAALYRDFSRGRDDACVVVIREGQP